MEIRDQSSFGKRREKVCLRTTPGRVRSALGAVLLAILGSTVACDDKKNNSSAKNPVTPPQSPTGSPKGSEDAKGDGSTTAKGGEAGFLKDDEFILSKSSLPKVRLLRSLGFIKSAINRIDGHKLEQDDSDTPSECDKMMEKKTKISANEITIDTGKLSCSDSKREEERETKAQVRTKGFMGCDKKAYDGLKVEEFPTTDTLARCKDGKLKYLVNNTIETQEKNNSLIMKFAVMKKNGSPCELNVKKSEITLKDGCFFYYQVSQVDEKIVVRAESKSVAGNLKEPMYTKGTFDVTINNWKGSVKIAGNDSTITLTSSKGEKVSGKLKDLMASASESEGSTNDDPED